MSRATSTVPTGSPSSLISGVTVATKMPPSAAMIERSRALGRRFGVRRRDPVRHVGAHELGERPLQQLVRAAVRDASRTRRSSARRAGRAVGDDDEIDERVERVLEQAPLQQHLLEQLDVLDADRELPPEVCRAVERCAGVEFPTSAFDDERAERPAPAAQGRDQDRSSAVGEGELGPRPAAARVRADVRILGRDPLPRAVRRPVGRGDEPSSRARRSWSQTETRASAESSLTSASSVVEAGRGRASRRPPPEGPRTAPGTRLAGRLGLTGTRAGQGRSGVIYVRTAVAEAF